MASSSEKTSRPEGSKFRYVITGGPGVGKSTLIESLRKRLSAPDSVLHYEVARSLFETYRKRGSKILLKNPVGLNAKIQKVQLRQYESQYGKRAFYDRGLADPLGYNAHFGVKTPKRQRDAVKRNPYDLVFLLEPLPRKLFMNDKTRTETPEEAAAIHGALKTTYEGLGYRLIRVPFAEKEKRTEFVLEKIKEYEEARRKERAP